MRCLKADLEIYRFLALNFLTSHARINWVRVIDFAEINDSDPIDPDTIDLLPVLSG